MSHCDTVADSNGREYNRHTACHGHTHLDCFGDLVQIHMTGYYLIKGRHDTYHRPLSFFLCKT